jgi:hypothetical protein
MGLQKQRNNGFLKAISRSRAPQKRPKQELKLFERSEFLSSQSFRGAQGSLLQADPVNGCTFFAASLLVRFFMQVKK